MDLRRTRIVATLGPATSDEAMLEQLVLAGVDVARFNFSHGTHAGHAAQIAALRRVMQRTGRVVGILQDLQGPKIRLGRLEPDPLRVESGTFVTLHVEGEAAGPAPSLPVDYPDLFRAVHAGDRLLLDDGRIVLQVEEGGARRLRARVLVGGLLRSRKGINLPGVPLDVPGFTDRDAEDLAFGLEQGVDAVAISFVRSAADVQTVRAAISARGVTPPPLLIAKLERPEALGVLDEILAVSDGVMVARGDLAVELAPERVPVIQKRVIRAAQAAGRLVITATQMLDSMVSSPLPTRAEASDVANAVFDGTDAVMLSNETAVGAYPLEAVRMMDRILREAEASFSTWGHLAPPPFAGRDDAAALAHAAREMAHDRDVAAIAVFTQTGRTAWLMSKARPRVPILAFTPEALTCRRLAFLWGVRPHLVPFADSMEKLIGHVEQALRREGAVAPGQQVVLVAGFPVGESRPPNFVLLHTVGK